MIMKTLLKGLIMALVGFIASYISQSAGVINWMYILIASVAFVGLYIGKNAIFPSYTVFGEFNLRDLLSGLIIAVSMAVSDFAATLLTSVQLNWNMLLMGVLAATMGYFMKTFFSPKTQV